MKRTSEAIATLLLLAGPALADPLAIAVTPTAETEGTTGDADDPAIWVEPADPAQSLILGTDKTQGLFVYGLDGAVRQFLPASVLAFNAAGEVPSTDPHALTPPAGG